MLVLCADRSKRSYLSSVMSKEPSFVNVGTYHYALRAFPGVTEAGATVGAAAALDQDVRYPQLRTLALNCSSTQPLASRGIDMLSQTSVCSFCTSCMQCS